MEGLHPIPLDVIFYHICPYLSLRDLRRCMRVSKSWFFTMISDGAFSRFKAKILRINPELRSIFDAHPWNASSMRPSAAKKRRKAWIMPRGGTWYVMKHYIDKTRSIGGLRKLVNGNKWAKLVFIGAVKRMFFPVEEDYLIENIEIESFEKSIWVEITLKDGIRHRWRSE